MKLPIYIKFILGCAVLYLLGMTLTDMNIPQPYAGLSMIAIACGIGFMILGVEPAD